jgi:uncharacterized membrane protein YphA (DoxX/SURF4 family)
MNRLQILSDKAHSFSQRLFEPTARIALFVIFFLFGFLKLVGLSPADDLAMNFTNHMGFGAYFDILYYSLAVIECVIGVLFLVPKLTMLASLLMMAHLVFVSSPIVLYPAGTWESLFVPNLSGQYIIKNLALIALAFGILSLPKDTRPSTK